MKNNISSIESPLNNNNGESPIDTVSTFSENLPLDELVVWLKPGKSHDEYNAWRDSVSTNFGEVIENYICGTCDNSLVLLKGEGIKTYITKGGTVSGGQTTSTSTKATGEDGPVYVSRNFRVNFSKPRISSTSSFPQPVGTYSGTVVKVAVFDTGIALDELNNFMYASPGPSCIQGADYGWNFIQQNSDYSDNSDIKHGSIVTRLITNQVVKFGGNAVEILPVKTHNKNGVSDLARILCAFVYAKERGVNIINASFGLYLPRNSIAGSLNPDARLIMEYVRHYLTENKILLVAAAGNKDDENEKAAFDLENIPYPNDPRNLDYIYFLPASLAEIEPNVIAVTTVHKSSKTVSPIQNYSAKTVDIGVNADAVITDPILGDCYVFNHPLLGGTETVEGSSFAAPIVTGILCANYDKFKHVLENENFTKEDLWNALDPIIAADPALTDKIKDGRYVRN
jgi:hypothetical protein